MLTISGEDVKILLHKLRVSKVPIHAAGATLGQEHIGPLRRRLENTSDQIIIVDFSGIQSATASYLKATILWLIESARLSASGELNRSGARGPHDPLALPIYPLVAGLNAEVRNELDDILLAYRTPCLETLDHSDQKILRAILHGTLDNALSDTLAVLTQCGSATATSLHDRFHDRKISATGWNNRLADLHELRLALRRKVGRQWLYEPVAAEVKNGREG